MTAPTTETLEVLLAEARPCSIHGYFVTEDGDIISTHNWRGNGARILTPFPNSHGYLTVKAKTSEKMKKLMIHKEVCAAFHGPKPSHQHQVRHLNGNRSDNRKSNLLWGTAKENAQDRTDHGMSGNSTGGKITAEKKSIPVKARFADGKEVFFPSVMAAVRDGYVASAIHRCLSGVHSQHRGAVWTRAALNPTEEAEG